VRILLALLALISAAYLLAAQLPTLGLMAAVITGGMICLGLGNGAVFQLVPQRFHNELGVATGVIGAIGGVGGFLLPTLLGQIKQASGSFSRGFLTLALAAMTAALLLRALAAIRQGWRLSWNFARPVEALEETS
jgi:NNP family nitrate/nitrite transporter-like MFS transporter